MQERDRNAFLSPVYHQIQDLSPDQYDKFLKIVFWIALLYIQSWTYAFAALELVITSVAGLAIAIAEPRMGLTTRSHSICLQAGILVSLLIRGMLHPDLPTVTDGVVLAAAFVFSLRSRALVATALVGLEHAASIFWSPAYTLDSQFSSASAAAHGAARVFAVGLIAAIVVGAIRRRLTPPAPPEIESSPSRPLSVAEWEQQNRPPQPSDGSAAQ